MSLLAVLLTACGGTSSLPTSGGTPTAASNTASQGALSSGGQAPVSFTQSVLPILQSRCVNCHGGTSTQKGLALKSYAGVMAGSQNGAVVVAGDPAKSTLLQMAISGKMPKRGPKLTPDQIQILTDWISAGAPNN